jgi:sirohydrochlorin cobaltochelatase
VIAGRGIHSDTTGAAQPRIIRWMSIDDDRAVLERLEARLQALLPQEYQNSDEEIEPVPMGSAGLKYDADGRVAWNEIWQSFCDLALAGGPPHKGRLLHPGAAADIEARPDPYTEVTDEICRGITMVTGLPADRSEDAGWIHVGCDSDGMAGWLLRAVTIENVSVRAEGSVLDLPAGPDYRIDKEIKNVITVIAKTVHYWSGHMWRFEQRDIAELFAAMEKETPLIVPASPDAWTGIECHTIRAAVWMTRMMVASNVLARREDTTLFVPVDAAVNERLAVVQRLATEHQPRTSA